MRLVTILKGKLYKLYANRCCKDITVKDGFIQNPEHDYNTLSEKELEYVENELKIQNEK